MKEFADNIRKKLKSNMFSRIYVTENTTSTMDMAREYAFDEEYDKSVFIALSQTDGQGTSSKKFVSDEGGLYMSILFNKDISDDNLLTINIAVCVMEALNKINGIDAKVKWVNDIFCDGKKICGILTRSAYMGTSPVYSIVGIGINVNTDFSGSELCDTATSLKALTGEKYSLAQIAADVLCSIEENIFSEPKKDLLKIYEKNCITIGEKIKFFSDGNILSAVASGITEKGYLIVENGLNKHIISSSSLVIKDDDI
ncbi:MAG: biotin--[acetyl-CoA-carboxylase] ligase [Anaerofustis stercorihominis]|nr:biotin--[acetyl-CoA-carboxylase] ligase [Anaerofustis stercorihominis]